MIWISYPKSFAGSLKENSAQQKLIYMLGEICYVKD